jgi:hypothetical protein
VKRCPYCGHEAHSVKASYEWRTLHAHIRKRHPEMDPSETITRMKDGLPTP